MAATDKQVTEVEVTVDTVTAVAMELLPLGALEGRIVDDMGESVGGVELTLMSGGRVISRSTTHGHGVFKFSSLAPGTYTVVALSESARVASNVIDVTPGQATLIPDIVIAVRARLNGTVAAFSNALVILLDGFGQPVVSTVADDNGQFEFAILQDGTYTVAIEAASASYLSQTIVVDADTPLQVVVQFEAGAHSIAGIVVDSVGQPVVGATITAIYSLPSASRHHGVSTVSDSSGTFSLDRLIEGTYHLSVAAPGYGTIRGPTVDVNHEDVTGLQFELQVSRRQVGVVRDIADNPLAGARLQLSQQGASGSIFNAVTEEDGAFLFETLVDGTYDLSVVVDGFQRLVLLDIVVNKDGDLGTITLTPSEFLISGIVYDKLGPVDNATVTVVRNDGFVLTATHSGLDGAFAIDSLEAAPVKLIVTAPGRLSAMSGLLDLNTQRTFENVDFMLTNAGIAVTNVVQELNAGQIGLASAGASDRTVYENYWTSADELAMERIEIDPPLPPDCATPEALRAFQRAQDHHELFERQFDINLGWLDAQHTSVHAFVKDVASSLSALVLDGASMASGLGSLRGLFEISKTLPWADAVATAGGLMTAGASVIDNLSDLFDDPWAAISDFNVWLSSISTVGSVTAQAADALLLLERQKGTILDAAARHFDTLRYERFASHLGKLFGFGVIISDAVSLINAIQSSSQLVKMANDSLNRGLQRYQDRAEATEQAISDYEANQERIGDRRVAMNDTGWRTRKNHELTVSPRGVLSNDIGIECGELVVAQWSSAFRGAIRNTSESGGFTFDPATDFVGTASLSYILGYRDDEGRVILADSAQVEIEVFDDDGDDGNSDGGDDDDDRGSGEGESRDDTEHVGSHDPNDILGPKGFGPENWISPDQALNYTIRYENDAEMATAPAQIVQILHELDSDVDLRTFRLGFINVGPYTVDKAAGRMSYQDRLDLTDEVGVLVDVVAGIKRDKNGHVQAFWELTSIDPETGETPANPLVGFLPPNSNGTEGQGFVAYSIRPREDSQTGEVIDAAAQIFFDINPPIDTPPIFNTLDGDPPESFVHALPARSEQSTFAVSWSGTDDGSGIRNYTVFVSENDGPFEVWLFKTTLVTAEFVGQPGQQYAFYTVATDNVGNTEAPPHESDASTKLSGITISPLHGLITTEAGGTAQFSVVLDLAPTADVTVPISTRNATEGTVSTSSLTFTPDNWDDPQAVIITGMDDHIDDDDVIYAIELGPATSDDATFDGIGPLEVQVTNTDDDTAGISVATVGDLITDEDGRTFEFTVALHSQPTADVTIELETNDDTEGKISVSSLRFTTDNWTEAQSVLVTGQDDDDLDGDVVYRIVLHPSVSNDPKYSGRDPQDISLTNVDNDQAIPGITVSPSSGLITSEAGATAEFTVVLESAPTSDVVIPVESGNQNEGTVASTSLTFTSNDWDRPQTVTITGVNDDVDDDDVSYSIQLRPATSDDPLYRGLDPSDVEVTNLDDDTAGVTVMPLAGLTTTEMGGTAEFTVVLATEPTADVTIELETSDDTEGSPSVTSLSFTSNNWSAPQTVTVTGKDEPDVDGDVPYQILLHPAVSTDPKYSGMDPSDVLFVNLDDDTVVPPRVVETIVQGGLTQRSYVDRIDVVLDQATNLATSLPALITAGAVQLTNLGIDPDSDPDESVPLAPSQFRYTDHTLSFSLDSFASTTTSLSDGYYALQLSGSLITSTDGIPLDGNGDDQPGGDYVFTFHVLQGDATGDLTVNQADMDLVMSALGGRPGRPQWNPNADLDRNDAITTRDRRIVQRAPNSEIAGPSLGVQGLNLPQFSVGWAVAATRREATAEVHTVRRSHLVDRVFGNLFQNRRDHELGIPWRCVSKERRLDAHWAAWTQRRQHMEQSFSEWNGFNTRSDVLDDETLDALVEIGRSARRVKM